LTGNNRPLAKLDAIPYPQPPVRLGGHTPHARRLSMNEMTTYRWSFLEDVLSYREAGLESIGVWRPKLVDFGEERGAELLAESGLSVSSLSWVGGFTGAHGYSFLESLDDACEGVRQAAAIQAAYLIVVSGDRGGFTHKHARRLVLDALRRLGDLAGETNLQIALQPLHARFAKELTFLTGLDEILEFLSICDHPQVGIAFDVYHLWQEPGLMGRIPELAPFVKTVQLSDGREAPRSDHDRCLLGDGAIPLARILGGLQDAGYQGFFDVQILSEELWNSDYWEILERCQSDFQMLASLYVS
jgi:sugar phosphate isomerase/epimerase